MCIRDSTYPFAGYKKVLGLIFQTIMGVENAVVLDIGSVSYTHLDVYKRQLQPFTAAAEQYLTVALVHFLGDGAEVIGK